MALDQHSPMLYMPIVSPPTPAPSPGPSPSLPIVVPDPTISSKREFAALSPHQRRRFLAAIIADCSAEELIFISSTVAHMLRRDFLRDLPPELAIYILGFVDDSCTLARAACVSKYWAALVADECLWKRLCLVHGFQPESPKYDSYRSHFKTEYQTVSNWRTGGNLLRIHRVPLLPLTQQQPTVSNIPHPLAPPSPSSAIPTSIALDADWVVVGLANSRIHVFSARTGVLSRTLVGHTAGVWAVSLIKGCGDPSNSLDSDGGREADVMKDATETELGSGNEKQLPSMFRKALGLDASCRKRSQTPISADTQDAESTIYTGPAMSSDPAGSSIGWGQPNSLVVSGGCDKELRVWDVKSGYCIYVLRGHTSTVRCLKVLHHRPIAVSGSRDCTVRVWDVQRGTLLRVLEGHESSVRCLDVWGNKVVTGSYDHTCRLWDVDTGECIHVLRGHFHQIYSVAFDGVRIASGGIDTTVRIWDAETGVCLALLQGHTALVCLLQLSPTMLVTGGSDGRVISFSLNKAPSATRTTTTSTTTTATAGSGSGFAVIQKLAAHDSSVTGLQLDDRFLVTSGNDGRVRLFQFDRVTGKCEYVREMTDPSESVWKVAYTRHTCAIMSKRAGKTVMEIWNFRPRDRLMDTLLGL